MRKIGSFCLTLLLIASTGNTAFSQEKVTLTLDKSISLALDQNPFYLASQQRVDAARSQVREAAAQFFPSLDAQALTNLTEKVFVLEFPSIIPGEPPQRIAIDFTRDYQLGFQFTLPLWTGGRLTSGYNQAKYNLSYAKEGVRLSNHETVFNVKRGFYTYLVAKDLVKVNEEALDLAEKLLENVKNMYEVGMSSRLDLLRAEVRVVNLRPALIASRNNVAVTELNLKTLLGLELTQPVEIVGELKYEPLELNLQECLAKAIVNRPEIKQLQYQKSIADEMVRMAWASGLPSVAVTGNYTYWGDSLNFGNGSWQNFYAFNLVLNIPVFHGGATFAKVAQSKAVVKELEHTEQGLLDNVKYEVEAAFLNLEQARQALLSQEKNIEQALESVRVAELNYTEGLVTLVDVGTAQVALTEARTNYLRAIFEYVIYQAQLEKAMGLSWTPAESF